MWNVRISFLQVHWSKGGWTTDLILRKLKASSRRIGGMVGFILIKCKGLFVKLLGRG